MRAGSINTTSNAIHALELYELALSLVQTKGAPVPIGKETVLEYRAGNLTIHYLPKSGHLDVWDRRKVLTIRTIQRVTARRTLRARLLGG
jgi:hypothetical protein